MNHEETTKLTYSITRRLEVDFGHRLLKHGGKCHNYHGHRYRFDVRVSAKQLDEVGVVIDFSKIKELVGGWLDEHWDHGMVLQIGDPLIEPLAQADMKHFVVQTAPTAENICVYLHRVAQNLLDGHNICVENVRCWETPNCFADSNGG